MKQFSDEYQQLLADSFSETARRDGRETFLPDEVQAFAIGFDIAWVKCVEHATKICEEIWMKHQQLEGTYSAGKKAGAIECTETLKEFL